MENNKQEMPRPLRPQTTQGLVYSDVQRSGDLVDAAKARPRPKCVDAAKTKSAEARQRVWLREQHTHTGGTSSLEVAGQPRAQEGQNSSPRQTSLPNGGNNHTIEDKRISNSCITKGMGTQVQYNTCLPEYYPKRDLNEHADSRWSLLHEDKTLCGHLYNSFALKSSREFTEHDKEKIKQIMLQHEAVFREQVQALHRVYWVQKKLMADLQKKELDKYSADRSQANSFSSQMGSESTNGIWHMPQLPVVNTSHVTTPTAGTDEMRHPLNLFKDSSVPSSQYPIANCGILKDSNAQESDPKKLPRRMFDLQLPAYVYIDSEDAGREFGNTTPFNKLCSADPVNDATLTLATGGSLGRQEDRDRFNRNGIPPHLSLDLNKPVGQTSHETSACSDSTHFINLKTPQGQNFEKSPKTSFLGLQGVLFQDRHTDEGSFSSFPYASEEVTRQERPFSYSEAGNSRADDSVLRNDEKHGQKFLHCTDMEQALSSGSRNCLTTQKDLRASATEGKWHASSSGISLLTSKSAYDEFIGRGPYASQMELCFQQGYHNMIPRSNAVDPELEWRADKGKCLLTTSQVENRRQRNEVPDSLNNKKILDFPMIEKNQQNAIFLHTNQELTTTDYNTAREKDGFSYTELFPGIKPPGLDKHIDAGDLVSTGKRSNSIINLNLTCLNNPYSTEISLDGAAEGRSQLRGPNVTGKVASAIDLEAPLASHLEENILLFKGSVPPSKMGGSQDTKCSFEATENIFQKSSDKSFNVNAITRTSPPETPSHKLQWFAEFVLFNDKHTTASRGMDGCSEPSGLDHLDLMTLKLEETKVDEYQRRPQEPENQKKGEKGAASLLLTKPQKVQTRRGRQPLDCSRVILLGLPAVPIHELKSGTSLPTGMTRCNKRRNGSSSQTRGRRQPKNPTNTVAENQAGPLPLQSTTAELELDGRTMMRWGKTMRRSQRKVSFTAPLT